jgi:hypothetical protein
LSSASAAAVQYEPPIQAMISPLGEEEQRLLASLKAAHGNRPRGTRSALYCIL